MPDFTGPKRLTLGKISIMKISLISLLSLLMVFSACEFNEEDAVRDLITDEEVLEDDLAHSFDEDCFDFIYPISFTYPDGTVISGNEDELDAAFEDYARNNPDVDVEPTLVLPVKVFYLDRDDLIEITSEEGFERLLSSCEDRDDDGDRDEGDRGDDDDRDDTDRDNSCFEFVYPISFTMPDGTTISGTARELTAQIADWYENNPRSDREPEHVFPVSIVWIQSDEEFVVENLETLEAAYERCENLDEDDDGGRDEMEDCVEFVYPLSVEMPDGTILSGNQETLRSNIAEWLEAHPDARQTWSLVFPLDIIIPTRDAVITVQSEAELDRYNSLCNDSGTGSSDLDCPDLNGDIGDACRKRDGSEGQITRTCSCE